MDSRTGSITMRLRFENKSGILVPGAMVQVRTRPMERRVAVIMPQEAIMSGSSGDYVYAVDANNTVSVRPVGLGAEVGTMREVVSGLNAGETIIVRGLQSVRPGIVVSPLPVGAGDEDKTPAELAMESGYDLQPLRETPSGTEGQ
jgi:RND family efflux transporter MFP subunit